MSGSRTNVRKKPTAKVPLECMSVRSFARSGPGWLGAVVIGFILSVASGLCFWYLTREAPRPPDEVVVTLPGKQDARPTTVRWFEPFDDGGYEVVADRLTRQSPESASSGPQLLHGRELSGASETAHSCMIPASRYFSQPASTRSVQGVPGHPASGLSRYGSS